MSIKHKKDYFYLNPIKYCWNYPQIYYWHDKKKYIWWKKCSLRGQTNTVRDTRENQFIEDGFNDQISFDDLT